MATALKRTVLVDGVVYPAGTAETAELKAKVTNPRAWDGESDIPAELSEPPRSGKGSGEEAWRTYAVALDVEVPAGASRDDIIALVDEAANS